MEVLLPFRVVEGLTPRGSTVGMMGKVLVVECQCRSALCQTQLGVDFTLNPLLVRILTVIGVGQPWNVWRKEVPGIFSLSFSSLWQTKPRITTALLRNISEKCLSQLKVIMVAWCSLCMLQKDIFSCRKVHYWSCRRCWNTDISWFSLLLYCVFVHHSCAMLFHPKDLYTIHNHWFIFFPSNVVSPEPAVIH